MLRKSPRYFTRHEQRKRIPSERGIRTRNPGSNLSRFGSFTFLNSNEPTTLVGIAPEILNPSRPTTELVKGNLQEGIDL